jgi:hypothetical protein
LIGDSKNFWAIPKPARIPPQTPPAGGKSAEAGQIQNPRKIVCPAESALFPFHSLGFSAKWVLTFSNKHHHFEKISHLIGDAEARRIFVKRKRAVRMIRTARGAGRSVVSGC